MSSILYYSNYCEKCKDLLRLIGKSDLKNDMHFVCIDKRFRDPQSGGIYVTLETQQKILLPPQIQKVPAMLLLKEGNTVIFGNDVMDKVKPKEEYSAAKATGFNGDQTGVIETPKDEWSPDKVGETAMKDMEEERNKDLQMQQMSKQGGQRGI